MDENKVTYFAQTDSRNKKTPFGIRRKDRSKHTYVIGKTGMGKSTLLENMAIQDIQNGEGMAFIDPHGKTAELLLEYIPENRIKDVLYFAPFDMEYPISFNVMEDVGPDKRHLVANGLMSTFEKIWVDAWSARMAYILNNTILALLEFPGSTLLSVNRMLSDKDYRKKVVENVTDPSVKSFWIDEFGKYTEKFAAEATPAIQNKVGQFTSNPLIRNIIGQPKSTFDIRKMMDERKILIVNLSKGRVGEGNANLLGSMLITKIYLAAMSRADISESDLKKLPNFYLYVDEFQSFANKSFADILSEARKYKLNLTIAHQYIEQMEEEVRAAVFGNVGTMITFRVGAYDAEVLEKEFAPQFTAEDLVNLGFIQIYLKLMIDGVSSQPFSATTLPPIALPPKTFKEQIVDSSRSQFGQTRARVEEEIKLWHESSRTAPPVKKPTTPREMMETMSAPGPAPVSAPIAATASFSGGMTRDVKENRSSQQNYQAPSQHSAQPFVRPQASLSQPSQVTQPQQTRPVHSSSSHVPNQNTSSSFKAPSGSGGSGSVIQPIQQAVKPISLNDLKSPATINPLNSEKSKKERSAENVSALKEALAAVMKTSPNSSNNQSQSESKSAQAAKPISASSSPTSAVPNDEVKKSAPNSTPNEAKSPGPAPNGTERPRLSEVPREVLEKLLEVSKEE